MAAYDVELVSVPPQVATMEVAQALNLGFDETATILGQLPALIAQSVDESDAEAIFHALRDLDAEVRLNPVAGPPSQRPSARPGSQRPSFRPPVAPSSAPSSAGAWSGPPSAGSSAPPSAGPSWSAPPSGGSSAGPAWSAPPRSGGVEPIDLPGLDDDPFEFELDERGSGSLRPPPAPSEPPGGGIPLALADTVAPSSSLPPVSRPPSQPARPMSSRPAGPAAAPEEELLGEARGSFLGAVPGAYAYAFNPGVMLQGVLTALVAAIIYSFSFGIFAIIGILLAQGVISVYLFAIIGRGSMGKKGAPAPADGNPDELFASAIRVFLAFAVPLWLLAYLASKLSEVGLSAGVLTSPAMAAPLVLAAGALWLFYLPSSLILAAHGQGCLGGLNLIAGVKLIARAPIGYLLLWISLVPVVGLLVATTILGGIANLALPFGGGFVMLALCMFPLAMGARLLGLYIYHYEYELGLA